MAEPMTQIAVVEDTAGIRQHLERVINAAPGLRCVGACADAEDALQRLPALRPQVVLMDISLPGISGIECARRLKQVLPETQILMVTVHNDSDRVFQALAAGASGYLLKRSTGPELCQAIRDVLQGGGPMSGEIARKVIETFHKPVPADSEMAQVSPRELEILELVSQGFANKEIADRLSISYDTVRTHLKRIYEKLHVRCRAEAVAKHLGLRPRPGSQRLSLV
jgi:DNA-binding NarL/FixJ family response regulator